MMKIRRWFLLIAMLLLSLVPVRASACSGPADGEPCPGKILCCIGGTEEKLPL